MISVHRSTILDAPLAEVWVLLRDFNSHHRWHPAIAASEIEAGGSGDRVGAVRRFRLRDGAELCELLIRHSDREHSLSYCILDSPIPLLNYVATIRLRPVTDGDRTFWEWSSRFATPPGREAELRELVGEGIYQTGFDGVRRWLRERRAGTATTAATSRSTTTRVTGSRPSGAVVLTRHGGPENLQWQTLQAPPPGEGEVRVRHTAIGVNFIDIYCRTGYFKLLTPPGVLGMEAAGEVLEVGAGVGHLRPGERVVYACPPLGAYAEIRTLPATHVVALPDDIDEQTAAAGFLKGLSAEFLLHRVHRLREGETVLVHAAAGGVGSLLCQWCRHLGATVIGTVGGEAKMVLARKHGCSAVIDYRREDFVSRVRELTDGRGVDVVFDAVGRDTFAGSVEALAVRGHLVSYGQASGRIEPIDIASYDAKSVRVSRPNFAHYGLEVPELRVGSERLFEGIRRGWLEVAIGQRFALREAADAHRALEGRGTVGATVLVP